MHQQALIGLSSLSSSSSTLFLGDLFPLSRGFNCLCSGWALARPSTVPLGHPTVKQNSPLRCPRFQPFTRELHLSSGLCARSFPEPFCQYACTQLCILLVLICWLDYPAWPHDCSITMDLSGGDWTFAESVDLLCSWGYWGIVPFGSEDTVPASLAVTLHSRSPSLTA